MRSPRHLFFYVFFANDGGINIVLCCTPLDTHTPGVVRIEIMTYHLIPLHTHSPLSLSLTLSLSHSPSPSLSLSSDDLLGLGELLLEPLRRLEDVVPVAERGGADEAVAGGAEAAAGGHHDVALRQDLREHLPRRSNTKVDNILKK